MRTFLTSALLLAVSLTAAWGAEKGDFLTEEEADQLRDAQDPSQRIEKYLEFSQVRLERFDDYRNRPPNPDYDVPGYLETQLDQYIRITDALKDWIEDQFDRHRDMRAGLKTVLEMGTHQLEQMRHIEQSSDPYTASYRKSLSDAIDDFTDALDGATKALSGQTKVFGELKREEKVDVQTIKDREKAEKRSAKDEGKLRKKEHESGPPTDKDED
jgi:hypothetical protein